MAVEIREFEGVEIADAVKHATRRERRKPLGEQFKDAHEDADNVFKYYAGLAAAAFLFAPFPFWSEMILAATILFALAYGRQRGKLWNAPYRVPVTLGKRGFKDRSTGAPGKGVIYHGTGRGRDFAGQEVWSDARDIQTHRLVVGTTGSGKSEELFGNIFNLLCLGSGALMVDGKASKETYDRMQCLARMFGRDEDFFCLNFIMGSKDYAGWSETKLSNTFNPFALGSSDQKSTLMSIFLPKDDGGSNAVFQQRAMELNKALPPVLSFLQERGYVTYNPKLLIEFFELNNIENLLWFGIFRDKHGNQRNLKEENPSDWLRLRRVAASLESAIMQLPGYSQVMPKAPQPFVAAQDTAIATAISKGGVHPQQQIEIMDREYAKMTAGAEGDGGSQAQEASRAEVYRQWGYMTMSLSEPAAMLTHVYGHIFNAEVGELNMADIFLNRRLVFVMIPSLTSAPQTMRSLGKISVAAVKLVLGNLLASRLEGQRRELLEAQASNAPVPYSMIFDEYGYYVVEGFSVVAAQARSFGVSCTFGMQSTDSLKKASDLEAAETIQNTTIRMVGKFSAGEETDMFKMASGWAGRRLVPTIRSGTIGHQHAFRTEMRSSEVSYEEQPVIRESDLNGQSPGQFHMIVGTQNQQGKHVLGESRTIRLRTLYTGDIPKTRHWRMTHFVQIKPRDQSELDDIRRRDGQERLLAEIKSEAVLAWASKQGEEHRIHTVADEDMLAAFFERFVAALAAGYDDDEEAAAAALKDGKVEPEILRAAVEATVREIERVSSASSVHAEVKAMRTMIVAQYASCVGSWDLDAPASRMAQEAFPLLLDPALRSLERANAITAQAHLWMVDLFADDLKAA